MKTTIGGSARQSRKQSPLVDERPAARRRRARRASGTKIHGASSTISPSAMRADLRGAPARRRARRARPERRTRPSRCSAFQTMTGEIIASATSARDDRARDGRTSGADAATSARKATSPSANKTRAVFRQAGEAERRSPPASHSRQTARSARRRRRTAAQSASAAPASANSSGPSGTIQPPAEAKKNGDSVEREQRRRGRRARRTGARVSANISQPVAANSAMNGSRIAWPSPSASAAKWAIH